MSPQLQLNLLYHRWHFIPGKDAVDQCRQLSLIVGSIKKKYRNCQCFRQLQSIFQPILEKEINLPLLGRINLVVGADQFNLIKRNGNQE